MRLAMASATINGTAITYDANGNMLNDGSHAMTWDVQRDAVDGNSHVPIVRKNFWLLSLMSPERTNCFM
jgi:hypothetical protein